MYFFFFTSSFSLSLSLSLYIYIYIYIYNIPLSHAHNYSPCPVPARLLVVISLTLLFFSNLFPGFHDDNYPFKDPDRDRLPEPANYDRLPNTYQNTYNQQQGIPQLRPDSAPRALGELTYREYNDATLDMKNTARIWSTEEFSTIGPPQYRPQYRAQNYNYAYNNDTMDGIL